jgi:hypothetical protein
VSDATKIVRALLRRLAAKDKVLAAYRLQSAPSAKTFTELDRTKNAVADAEAWLAVHTPPRDQSTEGET